MGDYFNGVMQQLMSSGSAMRTVRGVARQTAVAAAGTAAGGLLLGPPGALVGGVLGAVAGYAMSDDYDSLLGSMNSLTPEQKKELTSKIQEVVGSTSLDSFIQWFNSDGHKHLLLTLLMEFMRSSSTSSSQASASTSSPPPYYNSQAMPSAPPAYEAPPAYSEKQPL